MNLPVMSKNDDYMTPKSAWEAIKDIVENKISKEDGDNIWEPFFGDGESFNHMVDIWPDHNIHSTQQDFFEVTKGAAETGYQHIMVDNMLNPNLLHENTSSPILPIKNTVVITNPPFSQIPKILKRLKKIGMPFIMIMPSAKICTQYFRKIFACDEEPIQLIIPKKRIQFIRKLWCNDCEEYHDDDTAKKCCNFDCFYYCWKIGLDRDITWL